MLKAVVRKKAETMIELARAREAQQENDLLDVAKKNNTPFLSAANAANKDSSDGPKTALQRFMEKQEQLAEFAKILQ